MNAPTAVQDKSSPDIYAITVDSEPTPQPQKASQHGDQCALRSDLGPICVCVRFWEKK